MEGGLILTWYVVDGLDGSGKSTVAAELVSRLEARGRTVLYSEHPRRETRLGRLSRRYLLKRGKPAVVLAALFYFLDLLGSIRAVRRTECDDVVFVRYLLEVAYFPDGLYRICYAVASGVLEEQDVSILVDTDPDVAFGRIQLRGDGIEVFETPSNLSSTRGKMRDLASGWHVIDNSGT